MRVKIVYFSGTGNTRFLAEKLVEKFEEKMAGDMELVPVENALKDDMLFEKEGLILGVGYPVYDLMPPKIIMEFVNKMKKSKSKIISFVFSTYTSYPLDSNYYVIEKLQEKGLCVVAQENFKAPGASAYLYSNPNNPLVIGKTIFSKGINRQIDSFIINILNLIENNSANIPIKYHPLNKFHQTFSRMVFGNLFYKNLKISSSCISCGQCAKVCPDLNLIIQDGKLIIRNSSGCMRCLRCVQICNKKAINFTSSKRKGSYTKKELESAYNEAIV